jgi:hypothetical protein
MGLLLASLGTFLGTLKIGLNHGQFASNLLG